VRYDREASRYRQGIYKQKRADLIGRLDSTLSPLFLGQIKNLRDDALRSFKAEINAGVNLAGYNLRFSDVNHDKPHANAVTRFIIGVLEAVVTEGDPIWKWEDEHRLLKKDIQAAIDQLGENRKKAGMIAGATGICIIALASVGAGTGMGPAVAGGAAAARGAAAAGGTAVARAVCAAVVGPV
jgi:Root hair defective 3 GTP-binding protein (RHD3)